MVDDVHIAGVMLAKEADARRGELDRERRVPADLFQRAGHAGLFRQLVCAELGGLGRSPAEWFETGVEMARWEPSFAWIVTQGAGDMAIYVAAGAPAFTSAFLADRAAYIASSDSSAGKLAPEGDGFRFEGRWGFCSGCQGATWVGGLAELPVENGAAEPDWRHVLVPIERARIEETWDVMGMIGTGSHTVVVEPQSIPADWTFEIKKMGSNDYGQMSVAVGSGFWPIATAVAAVQLGTSRRALDAASDLVKKKAGALRTRPLMENAHVQQQLMRAEGAWSACYAGVEKALTQMWRHAEQNRRLPIEIRTALLSANAYASATAIEIIDSVCEIVGTSVAPARGIFGACLRDARTIGSHVSVGGAMLELAAQLRFGLIQDSIWV
jgi:alkylation response protein AidB-like acyl-CoA dehydrogenase